MTETPRRLESAEERIVELARSEGLDAALRLLDEDYASLRRRLTALISSREMTGGETEDQSASEDARKYWPPRGQV